MKRTALFSFFPIFLIIFSAWINQKVEAYNCSSLNYNDDDLVLSDEYDSLLSKYATQYEVDSYAETYGADATAMQKLVEKFYRPKDKYDDEYYFTLVKNIQILLCEGTNPKESRYAETNLNGGEDCQKNSTDHYIYASDFAGLEGQCEGPSTCYWEDVTDDESPRGVKYTPEEVEEANISLSKTTMEWGIPGVGLIALGILWLLVIFIVAILRCFCGCCGGRSNKKGYTCCQRWFPLIFYFIFTVLVIASAIFAVLGAIEFNTGVNQTFEAASNGLTRMQRVSLRLYNPLEGAGNTVEGAVNQTRALTNSIDWLVPNYYGIEKRFKKIRSLYGDSDDMAFFVTDLNATLATLQTEVKPIVDNMDTTVSTVSDSLAATSGIIIVLIDVGKELLSSFNTTIFELGESVEDANFTDSPMYSLIGDGAILALFVLSLLLICCGCCGIASGYTTCKWDDLLMIGMHCTWVIGTVVVFLALFISGLLVSMSIVWYDTCQVMDYSVSNFTRVMGPGYGEQLDAAWNGSSLLEAFNMSSQLEFADTLSANFDELGNMNVTESFQEASAPLAMIDEKLSTYNASTAMDLFNAMTNNAASSCPYADTYSFANITEPWKDAQHFSAASPSWNAQNYARASSTETAVAWFTRIYDDSACTSTVNDGIITSWYKLSNLTEILEDIRADIGVSNTFCASTTCPTAEFTFDTTVSSHISLYEGNVSTLFEKVENLTTNMVGELVENIEQVKCIDSIGFVKESYEDVHQAICQTLLNGVLTTAMSFVALGISMIGIVIITLVLHGRLKVDSKAVIAEREEQEEIEELEEMENDNYDQGEGYQLGNVQMTSKYLDANDDDQYA